VPDQRFAFAFDPRFAPVLALAGILPSTASVTLTEGGELIARFGLLRCRTPLANVCGVERTGPYRWYRAIGARLSFTDRGATFGTNTEGGVCLCFTKPVRALDPTGRLRHPGLTVTVADLDGFEAALRARR
jgi:hypothetical protein